MIRKTENKTTSQPTNSCDLRIGENLRILIWSLWLIEKRWVKQIDKEAAKVENECLHTIFYHYVSDLIM